MRVLVDANVLISAILSTDSPPGTVIPLARSDRLALVVSQQTLDEFRDACLSKRYLADRIGTEAVGIAISSIMLFADVLEPLAPPFEPYTRDPKDDYLIAHALEERIDILVSGDRHLLDEKDRFAFQILTPAELVALLASDEP